MQRVVAIARRVSPSFDKAIKPTALRDSVIDVGRARKQHDDYLRALQKLTDHVEIIEADEECPDCCFVEDTLAFARGRVVLANIPHQARRQEMAGVEEAFRSAKMLQGAAVSSMAGDEAAFLDGGDCLFTGRHFFVGVGGRTNLQGAAYLQRAFGSAVKVGRGPAGEVCAELRIPQEFIIMLRCVDEDSLLCCLCENVCQHFLGADQVRFEDQKQHRSF